MTRFPVIFGILFVICVGLMAGLMATNGMNLFNFNDTRAVIMLGVAIAVAAYVALRITMILSKRQRVIDPSQPLRGAQKGKLRGIFEPKKSASQLAREARVAAKREKLIKEGKLEDDTPPGPADDGPPTRVSKSASIKDKMAAREERVRRAKEQGKLPSDDD